MTTTFPFSPLPPDDVHYYGWMPFGCEQMAPSLEASAQSKAATTRTNIRKRAAACLPHKGTKYHLVGNAIHYSIMIFQELYLTNHQESLGTEQSIKTMNEWINNLMT